MIPMRKYAALEPIEILIPPPIMQTITKPINIFRNYIEDIIRHASNAPTDKLPPKLQDKLREIQNSCGGFHVVSTTCGPHGHSYHVAGTSRVSLHCLGLASDFVVDNYSCAYNHLQGWPGGYSVDPLVVRHIHISLGGREDGVRFVHGGHGGGGVYAGQHTTHHHHVTRLANNDNERHVAQKHVNRERKPRHLSQEDELDLMRYADDGGPVYD